MTVATELNALIAVDSDFYTMAAIDPALTATIQEDMADWTQAQKRIFLGASTDANTKNPGNTTNLARLITNKDYDRTTIVFHTDIFTNYVNALVAAYMVTRNFDVPNSWYTMKYKSFKGVVAEPLSTQEITAVTGFVPKEGLKKTAGHLACTYAQFRGKAIFVEGNVASGEFLSSIHFIDYVSARTQEAAFGTLTNTAVVSMTNPDLQTLVAAVKDAFEVAEASGGIAIGDLDDSGAPLAPYTVTIPDVLTQPASLRAQGIAPQIVANFRSAGAVHYGSVRINVTV